MTKLGLLERIVLVKRALFRSAIYFALACVGGWYLQPIVFRALDDATRRAMPKDIAYTEAFVSILDPFFIKVRITLMLAAAIAAPLVLFEFWRLIAPALSKQARVAWARLVPVSLVLFGCGAALAFRFLPLMLRWLGFFVGQFAGTALYQQVGAMVQFALKMMLVMGVGFQLPVLVFLMARTGAVSPGEIVRTWRQVVVVIFVLSAVFTPPDPASLLVMSLPLCALYLLSVVIVKFSYRDPEEALLQQLD